MDKVCVDCGSNEVYEIEFRTDGGVSPRNLSAVNPNIASIDEDDLPKYLGGHYCHSCEGFCSIQ